MAAPYLQVNPVDETSKEATGTTTFADIFSGRTESAQVPVKIAYAVQRVSDAVSLCPMVTYEPTLCEILLCSNMFAATALNACRVRT